MMGEVSAHLKELLPGAIVSSPDASLYSVVDLRDLVGPDFDAMEFVRFCASEGAVDLDGVPTTLLTAPMAGFYSTSPGEPNPGRTQLRIAYIAKPETMAKVPGLFAELLKTYLSR
jgi:aspartate aminotransferase